ncbi:MAG: class B sortase, partial [Muribaculaceae bacterium]|nr:class B sortase [Muribaculaceae bacterium]
MSGQAVYKPDDLLYRAIDLKAVQALNPDVSGYIYIPGIPVDYPILKEAEPGKYYYIDHNIYKKADKYGSIFELCDGERGNGSAVTWVFGHHMSSGSMFSGLYEYLEPEFAGTMCYVYRDNYRSEYEPFAACLADMNDSVYAFGEYGKGSESYKNLLGHLKTLDRYPAENVEWPDENQDILILSTCYGGAGTRNRLVVLFREVRRAAVPEYYDSLRDVSEYGGDASGVSASEIPGYEGGGAGQLQGMDGLLD